MNSKIVFIDVDGTLFDNEQDCIHPSTLEAIAALKKNNHLVCIASGRSKQMVDEVLNRYHIDFDGYVLINGQYVLYQNQIIFKNPLTPSFITQYVETCQQKKIPYGFLTAEDTFVSDHSEPVIRAFDQFKIKLPRIEQENDFSKDIYQGLLFDLATLPYFSQKYKEYVQFLPWIHNGADLIPNQASKAVGIQKLCEYLTIRKENIIAFGDATNDIEMLEYAQIGIAMGNAKEAVKSHATYITDSIEKDGLYNALKHLHLI